MAGSWQWLTLSTTLLPAHRSFILAEKMNFTNKSGDFNCSRRFA